MDKSNFMFTKFENPATKILLADKERTRKAKPSIWAMLLKVHEAFHAFKKQLAYALSGAKRGGSAKNDKPSEESLLFRFIGGLLLFSFSALTLEAIAYWNGWDFQNHGSRIHENIAKEGWMHSAYLSWVLFRADYISYPIGILSNLFVVLSIIQSIDRMILSLGCLWIKLRKIKPRVQSDAFKAENEFPMVLVQIPMCNEKQVYEHVISAACQLDWPKDRFLIQVLDDSDDESIRSLIQTEAFKWSQRGANIMYRNRLVRTGYKAGNLKSAMSCDYVKNYEFVAILDADFQPSPDFLKKTVPHFNGNPKLGLVQARWSFVNKDENLLTQLQYINLCFHFEVEQQVNGVFLNFFGFNGTAGVWRIEALEDCGGWIDRTTVEDMDLAVRAHLKEWNFILLNDVRVPCEAPESYETFQTQQHRWHSGPVNLFRFCLPAVFTSKLPVWKKANLIFLFFLLRKLIIPFCSFLLIGIIFPVTMFVPGSELPGWVICHMSIVVSLINLLLAPGSFPYILVHVLFENTMSMTKFNAMISGLLQLGSSYEWVVTKKAGRPLKPDSIATEKDSKGQTSPDIHRRPSDRKLTGKTKLKVKKEVNPIPIRKGNKIYKEELALSLLLLAAAARSLLSDKLIHFYALLFQGLMFLIVGLGLLGEQMI